MDNILYYLKYLNKDLLLENLITQNFKYAFDYEFLKKHGNISIQDFYDECVGDAEDHLKYLRSIDEQDNIENPGFVFPYGFWYDNNDFENKYKMETCSVIYLKDLKENFNECIIHQIEEYDLETIVNFLVPKTSKKDICEILQQIIFTTWVKRKTDFFKKINNGNEFKTAQYLAPEDLAGKKLGLKLNHFESPKGSLKTKYANMINDLDVLFLDKLAENSYQETVWEIKDKFATAFNQ